MIGKWLLSALVTPAALTPPLSPMRLLDLGSPSGLKLRHGLIEVDHLVEGLAAEHRRLLGLVLVREPDATLPLARKLGAKTAAYHFRYAGIEVCDGAIRAHVGGNGEVLVLGEMSTASAAENYDAQDWVDLDATLEMVGGGARPVRRCWFADGEMLRAAWEVSFEEDGLPHAAFAAPGSIYRSENRYLAAVGKAKVFERNVNDGGTVEVEIADLVGDGSLATSRYRIESQDENDHFTVPDRDFRFEPEDPRFKLVSAIYNVGKHLQYMEGLGFAWPEGATLPLVPHYEDPQNAFFDLKAYKGTDLGSINFGDGGNDLGNLQTDTDVASHESTHVVIYQTLKALRRGTESYVVHEALADFFTFARTGDACLGESICVSPRFCVVAQCLRVGNASFTYLDPVWMKYSNDEREYTHKNGQLFSGMLLDLVTNGTFSLDEIAKLTYRASTLFQPASGFRDFMLTLAYAEQELHGGVRRPALLAAARARGLTPLIEGIPDAGAALPQLDNQGDHFPQNANVGSGSESEAQEAKRAALRAKAHDEKKKDSCGTVAGVGKGQSEGLLLLAMFLLPMLWRRRPAAES